jgi:hypothetical protein
MRHLIFALGALSLASCASPTATDAQGVAAPLGVDTSCNADEMIQRGPNGAETRMQLPISVSIPASGTAGEFCMATGCEPARIEPTLTRALGWTARVITNERSSMNAEIEISRDRSSFRLRRASSESSDEWSGACNAAGS